MGLPVSIIKLAVAGASYRGVLKDIAALKAVAAPQNGDLAQVYREERYYTFSSASTGPEDLGTGNVIAPGAGPGFWLSTPVPISGTPYNLIELSGLGSDVGDGASITTYEWILVSDPTEGLAPAVVLQALGSQATLKMPVQAGWTPGGTLVFLRVTNNIGQVSVSNPFDPLVSASAKFELINATYYAGLLTPPAGARNWHRQYRDTMAALDQIIADVAAMVPGASQPTLLDKAKSPTGPTAGNNSVVSGVVITALPAAGGYVRVHVNGLAVRLGDGVTTRDCYFADPGAGAPAGVRAIADIVPGDLFVWNGVIAGYELDTADVIDFDYESV